MLGQTIDDAAGEAFDKFAKMLGLGFPGGVKVDQWAKQGDETSFSFPRPLLKEEHLNFSFSGLKTAGQRCLEELGSEKAKLQVADLCASYQQAIVDVLIGKLDRARRLTGAKRVVITGGVSANSKLRSSATSWASEAGVELAIPPLRYCTDNAAMIGYAGILHLNRGEKSPQDLSPSPRPYPGDFIYPGSDGTF